MPKKVKNFDADFNNPNDGTSGMNTTRLAREKNEVKMRDPLWIKKQQESGKIPRP